MNFKVSYLFLVVLLPHLLCGQQRCVLENSTRETLKVSFSVPAKLNVATVELEGVPFNTVTIDGFELSSEVGKPLLPAMREWIEMPVCGRVEVEVLYEEHVVLDGDSLGVAFPISPRQPSVCKTAGRSLDTLAIDRMLYGRDSFDGADLVSVSVAGIARDRRLGQLVFSPVRYNPVANRFEVYTHVEAVVKFHDIDEAATKKLALYHTPAFGCNVTTLNMIDAGNKKNGASIPIRYLIVSHPMFRGQFDDFVDWKRGMGYTVDVAYTDQAEVGSDAQSIRSYIKRQYTDVTVECPAPLYLLLVGDVEQLPTFAYSYNMSYYGYVEHVSDLNYACWTSDNLPDCHYGRLSAQSVGQLQHQIEKILMYERYEFPDASFLDRALLVAGVDGGYSSDFGYTHADPAMDYVATQYVNGYHGFRSVREFKNNTQIEPHVPNVSVMPNRSEYAEYIRSLYSDGAGWINYSAHGQWNRWDKPLMSNDHVGDMANSKKCGVMIGNCCLTAKFDEPVCFAEALMRIGNHCGAAAYIGSSNSTYWNEDFYWAVGLRNYIGGGMSHDYNAASRGAYDHLFHTHGEEYAQWASTMGALLMSGNMAVEGSTSDIKDYYWQVYHLFGDPSMMPWLAQAKDMPLSYWGADIGVTQFYVATAPYAYTAVTDDDNNVVGASFANGEGKAVVTCNRPVEYGHMKLSSIAQGYKTGMKVLDCSESLDVPATENLTNRAVKVSPNPTDGIVYIESDRSTVAMLFTATGMPVNSFGLAAGSNSINLTSLADGIYFLRTEDGVVAKIVKQ